MKCEKCGTENLKGANYCSGCGIKIEQLTVEERLEKLEKKVKELANKGTKYRTLNKNKEYMKKLGEVLEKSEKGDVSFGSAFWETFGYEISGPDYAYLKNLQRRKTDPRVKRMRFLNSRARGLIKQNPSLSYGMAVSRAAQEWDHQKPAVIRLPLANEKMLEVIKQAYHSNGIVTLKDCEMIGIHDEKAWEKLIHEVLLKSAEIAAHLNIPDKIRIVGRENGSMHLVVR